MRRAAAATARRPAHLPAHLPAGRPPPPPPFVAAAAGAAAATGAATAPPRRRRRRRRHRQRRRGAAGAARRRRRQPAAGAGTHATARRRRENFAIFRARGGNSALRQRAAAVAAAVAADADADDVDAALWAARSVAAVVIVAGVAEHAVEHAAVGTVAPTPRGSAPFEFGRLGRRARVRDSVVRPAVRRRDQREPEERARRADVAALLPPAGSRARAGG